MSVQFKITLQEQGLKIINFLSRCSLNEKSELYRWIKSGQVRVNSKRIKSEYKLELHDLVRLPPFATINKNYQNYSDKEQSSSYPLPKLPPEQLSKYTNKHLTYQTNSKPKIITKIFENEHLLVIDKPLGIACQGGTAQEIDLTKILKQNYPKASFFPAPAHRLDKDTSGVLLIGKSYQALRYLSDFMQSNNHEIDWNKHKKIYLTLVNSKPKFTLKNLPKTEFLLLHYLISDERLNKVLALSFTEVLNSQNLIENLELNTIQGWQKYQKNQIITDLKILEQLTPLPLQIEIYLPNHSNTFKAKLAATKVQYIKNVKHEENNLNLLKLSLLTGRKHQIRVQLSKIGFPIIGDEKYGQKNYSGLKLHALSIQIDEHDIFEQTFFTCKPNWPELREITIDFD